MPRFHLEAAVFGLAWATLAIGGGLAGGWRAGAALSVGLLLIIMPVSAFVLTRTDSFAAERTARWSILTAAALGLLLWLKA
jgi:hypothetical protein